MTAYPEAKDIYWNLGWPAPLPLRSGTKWPPPVGFSGNNGRFPQYSDLVMWEQMSKYRDGNICLRLPYEIEIDGTLWCIIGIDIDAYGEETGALTLAEAEKRWGPLPPTYRATSRTDGVSGIRLFRAPAGTKLHGDLKFAELGFGDIEFIQRSTTATSSAGRASTTRRGDVPVVLRRPRGPRRHGHPTSSG
jgi:hypothetical protein